MNVDNTQEHTCLSLCSGYGGLELGLKRACPNVRTVAYVEVEAFACANLVAKMEAGLLDAAPIWTDIKTFNAELFRDRIHIITAGYPCQPFSVAGKRQGADDSRHLWPYIARIIQAVRPIWCFFENVGGHLTIGFPSVYRSLRLMGYKVEVGLFTAAECSAPHRRERLFILAYNETSRFTRSNLSIRQPFGQKQTPTNSMRVVKWPTPRANMHEPCEKRVESGQHRHNLEDFLQCEIRGLLAQDSPNMNGKSPELWPTIISGRVTQGWSLSQEKRKSPNLKQTVTKKAKGKLNPNWVEQLMGLPVGWTACDCSETVSFPNKQKKHLDA